MKTVTTLALLALSATATFAHVSFETPQASQGSTYLGKFGISHGCEGESTLKVRVQIPEGVIAVKPVPKPGWTIELIVGAYENSYDYYGSTMTDGVKEIIWSGELLDIHFDQFAFRGKLTDRLVAGKAVYFPVIQVCANGTEKWVEIPTDGQDAHDLEKPAPGIEIQQKGHSGH